MTPLRYAVYLAPPPESALWRFGSTGFEPDATIDNDGALDEAVARLCNLVITGRRSAAP